MTPYHDPTGDQIEHAYYCYLADKFEADPTLLDIPLKTIDRWLAQGHWAAPKLEEWRTVIEAALAGDSGMSALGSILRADDEENRQFKGYDPFPAVLTEEEKQPFLWIARH